MEPSPVVAPEHSALLMIEFQNEWLDPTGRLRGLFNSQTLFTNAAINALTALKAARETSIRIVHTTMGFSPNYAELGGGGSGLHGAIAHYRTWQGHGREVADAFKPLPGEFLVDRKVAASAFTATPLDMYLRNNGIKHLYLAGFALHVCVSATGWCAHDLGYQVTVLADACAAFTSSQQEFVLNDVVHHFGNTLSTRTFINQLTGASHV